MTKPKFTPDPVPEGLDNSLGEYLSRQFNRMEDWWPKDLEARVAQLETLQRYKVGDLPIIDQSSVNMTTDYNVI